MQHPVLPMYGFYRGLPDASARQTLLRAMTFRLLWNQKENMVTGMVFLVVPGLLVAVQIGFD